ncbi:MAG: O-antigen ligase family protein [Solirubrobacteraceae bacterium]
MGEAARARAPRGAWIGVVALALFVAWTGLSITWSIAPDRSWAEFNRVLAYVLLTGVGVLLGAALPRAVERFAAGFLVVVSVVALYALSAKIAPGLVGGTEAIARLRGPLEYWNALGLLCALAAPMAIRLATDAGRSQAARLAALEALFLLAVVVGLTYSRGGVAAFLVGAAVLTLFGSGRLRGVIAMGLAILAAAAPLAVAFGREGLTANGAPLAQRIHDGRILGAVMLVAAGTLLAVGAALLRREPRVNWSGERTRRVFRIAAVAAGVLILVGAAGLARSQNGFTGTIDQAVTDFTQVKEDKQFDPVRLVSTNSGNRWSWWKEAAGAWSDEPITGHGAGTFALLHLRYRHDTLPVTQAHSMPMQLLAETGIVGLLLAYGAILALLAAAVARTRAMPGGRPRDMAVALLAAAAAWLVHGFYDWDFVIPAVTVPVLLMLAILAGRPDARAEPVVAAEPRFGPRAALLGLCTLLAVAAVISAGLPWLAAEKADNAAETSSARTPEALEDAAAEADLAARLNPLSTRPLFVAAAVAAARGRLLEARADLLEAVDRAPDDPQAWGRLAGLALQLADNPGYVEATERQFALDPLNPVAGRQLEIAEQFLALPASSATATGTPLTAGTPAPAPPPG